MNRTSKQNIAHLWMMKQWKIAFVIGVALIVSCGDLSEKERQTEAPAVPEVTVVNGVERSELALLMRKMYDEMKLVKDSIEQGMVVKTDFLEEFKRIQTAHATEPEKIDDTYQAMASAFLENYEVFESVQSEQAKNFNIMLQNCLVCHQHKCPGPVKAIKKLTVKTSVQPI